MCVLFVVQKDKMLQNKGKIMSSNQSFIIDLPLVSIDCKDNFASLYFDGCPLKKYLESGESVYVAFPLNRKLVPNTNDLSAACADIAKIRKICENCQIKSKVR